MKKINHIFPYGLRNSLNERRPVRQIFSAGQTVNVLLVFIFLGLYLISLPSTVLAQDYDICSADGYNNFNQIAGTVYIDHTQIPIVSGGDTVTIIGYGFSQLPASGMGIYLMATTFNCAQDIIREVPITVISDTQFQFQMPTDVNIVINDSDVLNPGEYKVTDLLLYYDAPCGDRYDHFDQIPFGIAGCGAPWGDPFPAPYHFQAEAKGDTNIDLSWDYDSRHNIDGFRFYMHWCKKTPFEDCSLSRRDPYAHGLGETIIIGGRQVPFWTELTVDQNGQLTLVPGAGRSEVLRADLNSDFPTFADSVIHIAATAYSYSQGETSHFTVATVEVPEQYGCYGNQPQRPGGTMQITIGYKIGETSPLGGPIMTPFPEPVSGDTLTFNGTAKASYDGNNYPIADYYGFPPDSFAYPEMLPFHHDPYTYQNVPAMALQMGRGYACSARDANGNCIRYANIAVDGSFSDRHGNQYYAAVHLRLTGDPEYPFEGTALVAGQAIRNQPDTIGMVAGRIGGNAQLVLPSRDVPGSISGSINGTIYYFQSDTPALPGEWSWDAQGNPSYSGTVINWFQNDITLNFSVPLVDDRCW